MLSSTPTLSQYTPTPNKTSPDTSHFWLWYVSVQLTFSFQLCTETLYHPLITFLSFIPLTQHAVKEIAQEQGLGEVMNNLARRKVTNIQQTTRSSKNVCLAGARIWKARFAIPWNFGNPRTIGTTASVPNDHNHGALHLTGTRKDPTVFFAHPTLLAALEQHRWLTFMDATHDANKHGWRLFTIYVRDNYGCWNVGGHFFVSNEDIVLSNKYIEQRV